MKKEQPKKVYISEVKNLLITSKEFKNGKVYGDEISLAGIEEVEWENGEEKCCIGTAIPVYGVVNKDNQILTEQLPFYFNKDYTISAVKQMNTHIGEKQKPYKVKKGYLFYPQSKDE